MKRWTLRIVILLLLGAIVNVAVAWGCALYVDSWTMEARSRASAYSHSHEDWVDVSVASWIGVRQIVFSHSRTALELPEEESEQHPSDLFPYWADLEQTKTEFLAADPSTVESQAVIEGRFLIAGGLPMNALWGDAFRTQWGWGFDGVRFNCGMLDLGLENWHNTSVPRSAPLRPIWPGFAINTVFYAAILFALCFGYVQGRRIIRLRRGRCPKCAYDLRGEMEQGCSECGWGRAS